MAPRTSPYRPRVRQGLWFPIALTVLVLVALPGAVLLALSLLGWESTANAWLAENLRLNYRNPLPTWAAIVLFLVPPLLVLLYFLKLRRKPVEVPSTFLWRKSIDDLHVNSLFQWLRDNVLLLVQLCIILLLIYSALAFQYRGNTSAGGKYYILLIDSSASMGVTDVEPSRLEAARTLALQEIDSRHETDTGMVIEFNSKARIRQSYTRDRGLLRAAVRDITQTSRPTRIDEALALADSLANPHKSADDQAVRPAGEDPAKARTYVSPDGIVAEVHLFSDGRFPDVPGFAAGNLRLEYHRVGKPGAEGVDNLGIVGFNAIRNEKDPSRVKVLISVANYRKLEKDAKDDEVTVELEWRRVGQPDFSARDSKVRVPRRVVEAADKETAARDAPGERAVTFDLTEVGDGADVELHAQLKLPNNRRDQFALDDEAWLIAGVVRRARVAIVTPGNDVLRSFFDLEATARVAAVTWLTEADLKDTVKYGRPARTGEFDLVIFDRCAPENVEALPAANTFFIGSVPPPWNWKDLPKLDTTPILATDSEHPLMRHLRELDQVAFGEARYFELDPKKNKGVPGRVPRLMEVEGGKVVLFVLPRQPSHQDLVLTFPLVNANGEWTTTWNFKLSFPVFLRNVLYHLGHVSDGATEDNVQPGEVKVLRPEGATKRIEVAGPAGGTEEVTKGVGAEFACKKTDRVGVYRATWPGGGRVFAVNLLDVGESNIQPRDSIQLGAQEVQAGQPSVQPYDTWKWVALAALVLLVLEWAVYHRRLWF